MDRSPPGSSVHGIVQARILEWIAMPSSRGSSQPRDRIHVSYVSSIGRWVLYRYLRLGSPIHYSKTSHPQVICSILCELNVMVGSRKQVNKLT